jgi:hypothetical protein
MVSDWLCCPHFLKYWPSQFKLPFTLPANLLFGQLASGIYLYGFILLRSLPSPSPYIDALTQSLLSMHGLTTQGSVQAYSFNAL